MREIVFRGKRMDNGEWVYGDLTHSIYKLGDIRVSFGNTEIAMNQVDPSTVGQFTGLHDKNDEKIFEGDIVSTLSGKTFEIKFADGSFYLHGTAIAIHHARRFTIAGNRWDNPKLLEEVSDNG